MGDATHLGVPQLAAVPGLQMVAGYVTGSPDILWTPADWAVFTGLGQVSIDQGFTGSPVPAATVRDVEPNAWTPAAAVNRSGWTAARPTIYCDQNDLERSAGVLASGWQGDLWLAIPGWMTGQPLPAAPGCTIVAVQDSFTPSYDLSTVLDPYWPAIPQENDMLLINSASGAIYLLSGGRLHHVTDPASVRIYQAAGIQLTTAVDAGEEAALLASFPPGQPVVSGITVTQGPMTLQGTITPTGG